MMTIEYQQDIIRRSLELYGSTDLGVSAMDKMKIVYAHKGEYQDER